MKLFLSVVTIVASCCGYSNSASVLPDFITPCKGTDPNLSECALKEANKVIPTLVKGYPKLNVPVLVPLYIPEIRLESKGQLHIILKDSSVYGLENSKVSALTVDLKKHIIRLQLLIDNLNIRGEYEVNGRVLVLPIVGKGPANITAAKGVYDIDFSFTLYEKKGVQFAKMENIHVIFELERLYVQFDNLFNGNQELSDQANTAINQEWRGVLKELKPAIEETVGLIVLRVANGVADRVPYADIFGGVVP